MEEDVVTRWSIDSSDALSSISKVSTAWTELNQQTELFAKVLGGAMSASEKFFTSGEKMVSLQKRQTIEVERAGQAIGHLVKQHDLLELSLKASNSMLNLTDESFAKVVAGGRALGKQLGKDTKDSIESLIGAMKTLDHEALAQMNIFIDKEKVLKKYAEAWGTTADQLDKVDKRMALQEEVLRQLDQAVQSNSKEALTAGDAWRQFKSALEDAKDSFSMWINSVPDSVGVMGTLIGALKEMSKTTREIAEGFGLMAQKGRIEQTATDIRRREVIQELQQMGFDPFARGAGREAAFKGEGVPRKGFFPSSWMESLSHEETVSQRRKLYQELDKLDAEFTKRRVDRESALSLDAALKQQQRAREAGLTLARRYGHKGTLLGDDAAQKAQELAEAGMGGGARRDSEWQAQLQASEFATRYESWRQELLSKIALTEEAVRTERRLAALFAEGEEKKSGASLELDFRMKAMRAEAKRQERFGEFGRKGLAEEAGMLGISNETIDNLMRTEEGFRSLMGVVEQFRNQLVDLEHSALKGVYSGLLSLADAAIQGQEGIGQMALNMLKAITFGLSQQLFAMGLAATIEAKGYLAGVVTAPLAAAAYAKAGIFYAGAATLAGLGLVASGIGAAVSGAAPGIRSATASTATTTGNYTPAGTPSYGREVKDERPINLAVYIGDPNKPSTALLLTKQLKAGLDRGRRTGFVPRTD